MKESIEKVLKELKIKSSVEKFIEHLKINHILQTTTCPIDNGEEITIKIN